MQSHNREDKPKTKNQHDDRVNPQPRALIRIKLEHRARRTTGTCGASRAGPGIPQRLLVVCSRAATQSSARTTGGSGRGRTVDGRGGSRGTGARARGLGVGAGFGAGGQGRGGTGRGLVELVRRLPIFFSCGGGVYLNAKVSMMEGETTEVDLTSLG